MRRSIALLALAGLAACGTDSTAPAAAPARPLSSVVNEDGTLPGRYIIMVAEGSNPAAVAADHGVAPEFVYDHVLNGFAATIADAVVTELRDDPRVVAVDADVAIEATHTQYPATWGLDRVSQRALPLDTTYVYKHTGNDVRAYIIDTGINYDHVDFEGRASFGADFVAAKTGGRDCNGHGTHVAGTVGGKTYGVAKKVKLVSLRVLDCGGSGNSAGMIAALNWIAANATLPAVSNMSIGFLIPQRIRSVDKAVNDLINSGVTLVLAAGNGTPNGGAPIDACITSPTANTNALVIGASDRTDTRARWSNYGDCVDFFSPGVGITSAWHTSPTATSTISGTSMAAPHTAGVAALFLQQAPGATPAQVQAGLSGATTKNVVQLSLSANNHLLYSLVNADAAIAGLSPTFNQPCSLVRKREGSC